jgi:Domain of unknown function (DUF4440)/Domain of unknown function (DUF3471)
MNRTRKAIFAWVGLLGLALAVGGRCLAQQPQEKSGASATITQAELERRTQELMDSAASGDKRPWQEYFADDAFYFDEKGRKMDKKGLVADVSPLPAGYRGVLKLANVESHIDRDLALMSYDQDETETVFGQVMTARYHETDTWRRRNGNWQIVAAQVLRYYEDPAAGKVNPASFAAYVGTYELSAGNRLVISTDGAKLYRKRGDQPQGELIPEACDVFFRKGVEGRIVFRHADQGGVDALIDRRNNEDIVWKKVG